MTTTTVTLESYNSTLICDTPPSVVNCGKVSNRKRFASLLCERTVRLKLGIEVKCVCVHVFMCSCQLSVAMGVASHKKVQNI